MEETLYTIGHSNHEAEYFVNLLKKNGINVVVDVRSTPYSQYTTQFNQNEIKKTLKENGIGYIHMGEEFGARRDDNSLYGEDGKLSFELTKKTEAFRNGIRRVEDGLEKGFRIAFMCAEKHPEECHRCILVGKAFYDMGYDVENILEDGTTISQEEIGRLLVDKYYPDRNQISLFTMDNPISEEEYLNKAYLKREKEIAYDLNGGKIDG